MYLFPFLLCSLFLTSALLCPNQTCIQDLNETHFNATNLKAQGWVFQNFPNSSNLTIEYLNESYIGGSDPGRIIFKKVYNITPPHHSLNVNFSLLEFEDINLDERLQVYADGIHVYTFNPKKHDGPGPHNVSFVVPHQNTSVLLEFRSEDSHNQTNNQTNQTNQTENQTNQTAGRRLLSESDSYNLALNKKTNMSSFEGVFVGANAVDGNLSRRLNSTSIAKTNITQAPEIPWFYVDLEEPKNITLIRVTLGENVTFENASKHYVLTVGNSPNVTNNTICKDGLDIGSGTFECKLIGQYVGIYFKFGNETSGQLQIAEIEVLQGIKNIAIKSTATQSSILNDNVTFYGPLNAVDGSTWIDWKQGFASVSKLEENPWFKTDLGALFKIFFIRISVDSFQNETYVKYLNVTVGENSDISKNPACNMSLNSSDFICNLTGRYIGVVYDGFNYLEMSELEAFGEDVKPTPIPSIPIKNYAVRDLLINVTVCNKTCDNCVSEYICTPKDLIKALFIQSLYDEHTFESEVAARWTYSNLSSPANKTNVTNITIFNSSCGDRVFLGGYGIMGPQSTFEAKFDIPAFHYKLGVAFDLLALDEFGSRNDEFVVYADGEEVFTYSPVINLNKNSSNQTNSSSQSDENQTNRTNDSSASNQSNKTGYDGFEYLCGQPDKLDALERVYFEFIHYSHTLKLKFVSNSTVPASQGSYGFARIDISFYQCFAKGGCFVLTEFGRIDLERGRRRMLSRSSE